MDINEALRAFGLSDKEIRIYLAALELGTAKANQIAEKSFSERTYTYQILRELQVKGLVSTIIKSGIKYFEVASPDNILSLLKEKEEKINLVLPQLNAMYKIYNQKPKIQVFEGRQGIKTMLNIDLVEKEWLAGVEKYTTLEAKYYTIASKIRQVKFPEKKEGDYTNGKYFKNDGEYNQAITQCEEAFKFVRDFVEDK